MKVQKDESFETANPRVSLTLHHSKATSKALNEILFNTSFHSRRGKTSGNKTDKEGVQVLTPGQERGSVRVGEEKVSRLSIKASGERKSSRGSNGRSCGLSDESALEREKTESDDVYSTPVKGVGVLLRKAGREKGPSEASANSQ